MQLNYDIDIIPPEHRRKVLGQNGPVDAHYAAFRDPLTAAAARRSSPRTISILNDAGIGLQHYSSGTPSGHYPLKDEQAREYLMARFIDAIMSEAEDGEVPAEGEFDLSHCLVQMSAAQAYGALAPLTAFEPEKPKRPPLPVYIAISILAAAGYITGFAVLS